MLVTSSDPSVLIKWFFRINRDNIKSFVFLNEDGSAKSLEGYEFIVRFKESKDDDDDDAVLTLTSEDLVITDNRLDIAVVKARAAEFEDAEYFVEVEVITAAPEGPLGETYDRNWFSGSAYFHNGRFDNKPDEYSY